MVFNLWTDCETVKPELLIHSSGGQFLNFANDTSFLSMIARFNWPSVRVRIILREENYQRRSVSFKTGISIKSNVFFSFNWNAHIKSIAVCPLLLFLDLDVLDAEAGGVHQVFRFLLVGESFMLVGWLLLRRAPYDLTVREGFKIPSHRFFLFHMKVMTHGDKAVSLMRNEDTWMDWT